MTSDPWKELGYAIRQARLGKGWSREQLAHEALGNGDRKSYVGQVEKGRRNLSAETIDKFDQVLSLPEDIVKAAHLADPPAKVEPKEEIDRQERDAEMVYNRILREGETYGASDDLLIDLANNYTMGNYRDRETAYIGVRDALEASTKLRSGSNSGTDFAFLDTVSELNNIGDYEEANRLFDAEEKAMRRAHRAEMERLAEVERQMLEKRLAQFRLQNTPKAAAEYWLQHFKRNPGEKGWQRETLSKIVELNRNGNNLNNLFDLRTALFLANYLKKNWQGAKQGKCSFSACTLSEPSWRASTLG
ncbi:MAG: helix-turn-helix transcriptional regulator [Pseudomonadota bacterium]